MAIFEGFASTAVKDDRGDVVVPEGARFKGVVPVQFQHDGRAIGRVLEVRIMDGGIWVRARLDLTLPGAARVWEEIVDGRMRALSIAFEPIGGSWRDQAPMAGGGRRYAETIIQEVSVCYSGKNPLARISRFYSSGSL